MPGTHKTLVDASLVIDSSLSIDEILRLVTEKAREIIGAHQAATSVTVGHNKNGHTPASIVGEIPSASPYDEPRP